MICNRKRAPGDREVIIKESCQASTSIVRSRTYQQDSAIANQQHPVKRSMYASLSTHVRAPFIYGCQEG